jgi:transcriptional regulator with XRE-family HTH domain
MSIGNRIKSVRTEVGISQKEFGERIGIADSYVSEIESGKKHPSLLVLLAIEHCYGAGVEWLQSGKGMREAKGDFKVSDEEKEIIEALRGNKELRKIVQLVVERCKDHEDIRKKVSEVLKVLFDF